MFAASLLDNTLKELLARIERQARPQHVLGSMAERFIAERPAILSGQRATLQAAAVLTLESRVGGRQGLIYRLTEQPHRVTLLCNARRVVLPAAAATVAALRT